jgi:hypothetical protein
MGPISRRDLALIGAVLTPRSLLLSPSVEVNSCKPEPSESAFAIVHDFIITAATMNSCWILLILLLKVCAIVNVIVESVCNVLCNEAVVTVMLALFDLCLVDRNGGFVGVAMRS